MGLVVATLFLALHPWENNPVPGWDSATPVNSAGRSALIGTLLCVAGAATLVSIHWGLKDISRTFEATTVTALVAAVTVATTVTACGPTQPHSAPPHKSSTTTAAATSAKAAPGNVLRSGVSNGQSYIVTAATTDGATPDGHGHWHIRSAQLTGQNTSGDHAVIAAFNKASDASAERLLDQARSDAGPAGWDWSFDVKPTVTFRPTAISDLLVGVYYARQAAHPVDYVSTIVIDSRTAQPITLNTLFSNESRGLERLSEQTKLIWPTVYGQGGPPMPDEAGNQPRAENFANWIPTATGMEIHFVDHQFGHGLPVLTIPWTALADVLAPNMAALATP